MRTQDLPRRDVPITGLVGDHRGLGCQSPLDTNLQSSEHVSSSLGPPNSRPRPAQSVDCADLQPLRCGLGPPFPDPVVAESRVDLLINTHLRDSASAGPRNYNASTWDGFESGSGAGFCCRPAAQAGAARPGRRRRWPTARDHGDPVDHYLLAGDVHRPNRVELVMTTSLSKTPACKQDPTVTKMASRFNATIAHRSGHADASRPASNTPTENHLLQDSVEYRYGRRRTRCCTTATDPRSSSAGGRAVAGDHQDLSTPTPAPWHGPTAWPGTGGLAAFLAGISDSALTFRNLDVLAQKISSVGGKPGTTR